MNQNISSNKHIAKNTIMLYARMLFLTVISLYTSRVLLHALGVEDYGIYNVVGGIVITFSFISSSLSSAIQRFISFAIGKNNKILLKETFDVSITIFIILGIVLFVIIELCGLYMLNLKMSIPENRMTVANIVLQFSLFSFLINVISIPYNSAIIAHEKMDVFAYFSITDFSLRLFAALLLKCNPYDGLILYAALTLLITIIIRILYQIYCRKHFTECSSIKIHIGELMGKEILAYSGWNMIGSLATILKQQGINLIQNIFFGPIINAAHAISIQVASALTMFANNVFLATRPSITKLYAQKEKAQMWILVFHSTKYTLYLFIMVVIPIYIAAPVILNLWLGNVPNITIKIVRVMILSISIELLCAQIFAVFQASNKLKKVQTVSSSIILLIIPISYYWMLHFEKNPIFPYNVWLAASFFFTITTLVFAAKEVNLKIGKYFLHALFRPLIIATLVFLITEQFSSYIQDTLIGLICIFIIVIVLSVILILTIGLTKKEKAYINHFIRIKAYNLFKKTIRNLFLREKRIFLGNENPNKTFYIIRVDYEMAGILAIVKSTLSHIISAKEKGYIPVVDLLNCECQYIDKLKPSNIWDRYFTQPCGYKLEDIAKSKNLIISKNTQVPKKKYRIKVTALYEDKMLLNEYRGYFKQNIHFNPSTMDFVNQKYNEIIGNKKCLGILSRGTDYIDCHPKGHPIQPEPSEIIEKAEEIMEKFDYQYIYLATEDKRIFDLFKKHFGEKLLSNNQKLISNTNNVKYISQLDYKDGLKSELDVLNYLSSLYILSKCNAFIGGCTAGTIGAYMMSEKYEYEYFWNLGFYKK